MKNYCVRLLYSLEGEKQKKKEFITFLKAENDYEAHKCAQRLLCSKMRFYEKRGRKFSNYRLITYKVDIVDSEAII